MGVQMRSCVIRWHRLPGGTSAPYLYVNPAHPCPGVDGVEVSSRGDLVVHPTPGVVPVLFAAANPDETFASLGIVAGCSVGKDVTVRFSRRGVALRADAGVLSVTTGNLWFAVFSDAVAPSSVGSPTPSPSSSPESSAAPSA